MKMTMRDRIIVLMLLLSVVICGGYQTLWMPANAKIAALEKSKAEVQGLTADISPLLKQSEAMNQEKERLQKSVDDIKMESGKTLTKEEFLLYLGKCTTENGIKLVGFNDLGTEESNGIYKAKFDFQLQGSAVNINNTLSNIDSMGVKYSVGSMSYRQLADYDYLRRFFDNKTDLPWYKEPEKKEEQQEQPSEVLPSDETVIPSQPLFPEVFPSIPETTPNTQPTPSPEISTPTPSEEPEDKNINDRLDKLLEQTSFSGTYKMIFLTNIQSLETPETLISDDMRLAVTICFLMFEKPDISNSFMSQQAEGV